MNFIEQIIEEDIQNRKNDAKVYTRFPPEPNGYLHIGHAKSICLNFGIAQKYGGKTNLRFDDTNPVKEDTEYVDSIRDDIKWLGFQWAEEHYASDYFDQLYLWAEQLIQDGLAYVDDQTQEEISKGSGFMGICKTKLYFRKEQIIFLSTLIIGIVISLALTLFYIIHNGLTFYGYYYCNDDESRIKRLCDTIFNGVFLIINLICTISLLIYITKKKILADLGHIEDLDYAHHHSRIIMMLIVNSLLFIESYLIIYDVFSTAFNLEEGIDLIYLISCIVIIVYYTINKLIIKETLKIFCKGLYDKKYPTIKKNDSITDEGEEENGNREENDSFSEE